MMENSNKVTFYFACLVIMWAFVNGNSTDIRKNGLTTSQESKLVRDLLANYKNLNPHRTRPVLDSNETLIVKFGIGLVQVLDFNEKDQMITSLIWKQYFWYDQYLVWNPEEYGGVNLVCLEPKDLWIPDIVLFNNAGEKKAEYHGDTMMIVNKDGGVTWIPAVRYQSSCPVSMKDYPFDEQTCYFHFGSWSKSVDKVDMDHIYGNKEIDMKNYIPNSEWDIRYSEASERMVKNYSCCEEPFAEIIYELRLERTMSLHLRLILVPTLLLSIMSCAIFWIPPNRPDRTTLGLGLFSAFFLLLISILNNSPPVPESKLGLYYIILLLLVAFGILFSVIIINVFNLDKDVPLRVDRFIQWVDRLSCRSKRPRGRATAASKKTPSSVEQGNKPTGPTLPPNKAKWQRFAWIVDRIVFILTVLVIVISYITVFPAPMFIFRN